MKQVLSLLLMLLTGALLTFSCDGVVLDEDEEPTAAGENNQKDEQYYQTVERMSVTEAMEWLGDTVWIEGYVVGCVEGTAISKANFQPPFTKGSNLLLADFVGETDTKHCFPISLPSGTTLRKNLNLPENPDILHRKLLLRGKIETYFGQPGIKHVLESHICEETEEDEYPNWRDSVIDLEFELVEITDSKGK